MITKQQAMTSWEFWHIKRKRADGTPVRCRRTGKCKTWKTRPNDFDIPVKHGIYDAFHINRENAIEWSVPALWPVGSHT